MKICFLIYSLEKGGAERVVSILTSHLFREKQNVEIHLLVLRNKFEYEIKKNTQIKILTNQIKSPLIHTLLIPIQAFRLKSYCQKNNIQVVLSFLYRSNYINVLAKLFGLQQRVLISERSTASKTYAGKSVINLGNRFLVRWLYKKADSIITVSKGVKDDLKNNFSIPKEKLTHIYNPYDLDFIIEQSKKPVSEEWLNNPKYKVLISIGRLIPSKRINDILSATKYYADIDSSVRVLFIGKGPEKNSLIRLAKLLNVEKIVKFVGIKDNPFAYLSKADALISASEREGFPNVIVEAMVCKCPVISTDCESGPKEILENGKSGMLVPVGDINKMVKAIEKVLTDISFRRKIVNYARYRAEDFSINKIIHQYEKAILG